MGARHRSARFGALCQSCPRRADCTKARRGRVISIHPHEAALQRAKVRQHDPTWQQDYRQHRPIVERKINHFTRRPWGARTARCRGQKRILTDILTRASVINLARLGVPPTFRTADRIGSASERNRGVGRKIREIQARVS